MTCLARTVVIASGYDGAGQWRVPSFVSTVLPADRYDHTNGPIDFDRLRGRRLAVLGHAASAFDNAGTALRRRAAALGSPPSMLQGLGAPAHRGDAGAADLDEPDHRGQAHEAGTEVNSISRQ